MLTEAQQQFLAAEDAEATFSGPAGAGKTYALIQSALKHVDLPRYHALIVRRTTPALKACVIDQSKRIIGESHPEAVYDARRWVWRFPSGARLQFDAAEDMRDCYRHDGVAYQFVGFDEVDELEPEVKRRLSTRARSVDGIPAQVRSTATLLRG